MSFYSSSSQRPLADPEVRPYLAQLDRALENELKFRGCPQPTRPDAASTITSGMRDGSAHVLRCLKMWYDLPPDVFFGAVSAIDRFLTKMKVRNDIEVHLIVPLLIVVMGLIPGSTISFRIS